MLHTNFHKHIVQTTLRFLNVHVSSKSAKPLHVNYSNCSRTNLLRMIFSPNLLQCRNFINDSQNPVPLPALTEDPQVVWPSFFKTVNNFIQCNFVIKPHMDREFNMFDFLEGSKHALSIVSNALAREDYESITDLVTAETLQNVKNKIMTLSTEQKQLIAVNKEDIYITFPYQVGIMFNNNTAQQRFVEITVVYHSLRGLDKMRKENKEPPINMGLIDEYRRLMFICNYRFIREFTKGVESSWTINMINHFMPAML